MGIFLDAFRDRMEKFKQQAQKDLELAGQEAVQELMPQIAEELQAIYSGQDANNTGAAKKWYDAYRPKFYDERNYSLYDLMDVEEDQEEMQIYYSFSDTNMTKDRKGGSLFNKVFRYGWHGGAYDRNSGTIRYRTPYRSYVDWGRKAEKTASPYGLFMKAKAQFESKYKAKILELTVKKFHEKYK